MANERVYTARNAGTKETPKWEVWFGITVADAVKMSDDPNDTKTIVDYVNQKIADLIGGAPAAYDTLKEIADYIASHQSVADALNNAIANKADKTVASTSANGLMSKEDKTKLNGIATGANNYVHPSSAGNKHIPAGGASGQILKWSADGTAIWGTDNNTTYNDMTAATADKAGTHGLVPAPAAGAQGKYLRGDGTWQSPPDTKYAAASTSADGLMTKGDKSKLDGIAAGANNYTHPSTSGNKHIPSGGSAGQFLKWNADGTAVWSADNNTTYSDMTAATADKAGAHGLVPAPAAGAQGKYLRGDGTWQSPPNTTYGAATASTNGLMSKEDKSKLDSMPTIDMGSAYPTSAPNNSIFLLIKSE